MSKLEEFPQHPASEKIDPINGRQEQAATDILDLVFRFDMSGTLKALGLDEDEVHTPLPQHDSAR